MPDTRSKSSEDGPLPPPASALPEAKTAIPDAIESIPLSGSC